MPFLARFFHITFFLISSWINHAQDIPSSQLIISQRISKGSLEQNTHFFLILPFNVPYLQATSRFYNHPPHTLLNRRYSLTFPWTTGKHFYISCCFSKCSTKFSLRSLTPLAVSTGPGESVGLYWVCAKARRASRAITYGCHTPADLVNSFSVLSNKTYNPSFLHVLKLKPLQ